MAKSFVLKDREGRMGGYLQLHQDEVRCRLTDASIEAKLIVYGRQSQYLHMEAGGREQRFPAAGADIRGAVVVKGEQLCFATDEASKLQFERTQQETNRQSNQKNKISGRESKRYEQTSSSVPACDMKRWPQRRWPPPVCWSSAVYDQGRWKEGIEAKES